MKVEVLVAGERAARGERRGPAGAIPVPAPDPRRAPPAAVIARWERFVARLASGGDPAAPALRRSLERLAGGAACVVTGQQAGVLTGPLLTVLKAARAVSLARDLEAASGQPVVPLFWIAADDHDLDEIGHTFVLNGAGEPQRLRLELGDARGAAGEIAVPEDAARALVARMWELAAIDAAALPPDPFLPRAGDSLSTWFARGLTALFGAHGLLPFEPALLGDAARPVYERALRADGAIARALREGAAALSARGVEPPLPADDDPPLFWIEPGARTRVRRSGGELRVGERAVAPAALLERCGPEAPRLSANVALRTVVQAAALPALAYVAGPHEIVYYEQLRPLHALYEVQFPELVERPEATVLSTAAVRALRKLGVPPRELFAALAARPDAPAERPELLARGERLRADVARYVDELLASSPAVKSAGSRRAAQLLQSFDGLLERAGAAHAEGALAAGLRWSTLSGLVRPRERPQDRSLNVLPFLADHGAALLDALLEARGEPTEEGFVPHSLILPG